jgi:flagellar biosynthesis protein FlhF
MNIKRFFARNSREALSQVRLALGEEAVILSNRAVDGGTEILAAKEQDMDQMIIAQHTPAKAAPTSLLSPSNQKQIEILTRRHYAEAPPLPNPGEIEWEAFTAAANYMPESRPLEKQQILAPQIQAVTHSIPAIEMDSIRQEMQSMREMLQTQLSEMAWHNMQQRDPQKSTLLSQMISAGFSASLARFIAEKSPVAKTSADAMSWLQKILAHNINCMNNESQLLDQGGVFAMIGPTGVGKTTTTAKLAARYVMKHGAKNLALITTDAYRIGGHEQLRIYGKILGVMVHAVKDQADLKLALQELKGKHTILIDTVGVSQRDKMVAEQIAMLQGAGKHIKKLLCLNATSTGETLSDVTRAYRGQGLDGAIITKLDEAATIGGALDIVIREKLSLYYVANGQRVPEDLYLADKDKLLQHAFKLAAAKQDIYGIQATELPALVANIANRPSPFMSRELSHG